MKHILPFFITLSLLAASCRTNENKIPVSGVRNVTDSALGIMVADTVIYEVNIINTNPEDVWAQECIRGLDHPSLVDNIFEMVYNGKAVAFDHVTGEKLTAKQVEAIEAGEGFMRSNIGMIQFKEAWYVNPGESEMTKEVLSMVLGMGVYSSNGEFKGNKAVFRVELRENSGQ